jgi:hypothetical protein
MKPTTSSRLADQHCQDALTINHHFKSADLFMTVTADPNWPEIQTELLPGQTATDRPDLVPCVFRAKLPAIMDDIKKGALGVSVAHVFTIKFQKRGLPHMHLIIFLMTPNSGPQMMLTLFSLHRSLIT